MLPVYGLLVPFHIATIKSVSSQQDGGHSYIRIIFNVPGAGFGPNDVPTQKFPRSIYVKEVSFRSNDTRHSYQVVQLIKTLRRQVAQRESERAERATLVTQERLQIGKGRPIRYFGQEPLSMSLLLFANDFLYHLAQMTSKLKAESSVLSRSSPLEFLPLVRKFLTMEVLVHCWALV